LRPPDAILRQRIGRPPPPLAGIDDSQATVPVLLDATVELEFEQLDRELRNFAAEPARQFITRCGLIGQRVENFPEGSGRTATLASPGPAPSNHAELIENLIRTQGHEGSIAQQPIGSLAGRGRDRAGHRKDISTLIRRVSGSD
jgi:hypothetical protein